MLRSLNSGVSGLHQFQEQLDVIGNNVANANTTAFKSGRVDFADAFSQTLQGSSPGVSGGSSSASMQVGSGVTTSAIKGMYTQGAISETNYETDLAINGDGFFMVRDSLNDQEYATRAGQFRLDNNGYLVTNTNLRLQGYSDGALSSVGDLMIDNSGAPGGSTAELSSFKIDSEGKINVRLADGTEYIRGQVLLQSFLDPQALVKQGNSLYSGIVAAGPLGGTTPQSKAPGTNGLGQIRSHALELSNVDLAEEFSSLITTQRAFQASARIITTSDEVLQELVNLKR